MYKNCAEALLDTVDKLNTEKSNVDKNRENISCPHKPTTCIISGNTQPVYACCEVEHTVPQTVYKSIRAGTGITNQK